MIGAVAINVTLCAIHPRLRRMRRKVPMMILGVVLLAIWVTLAFIKLHALIFVAIVMVVGSAGACGHQVARDPQGPAASLLRQAIIEQLTSERSCKPKLLLGTYGSESLATGALTLAKDEKARWSSASSARCRCRTNTRASKS